MKFTKKNPLVFFNILKELLLVQKQMIHQQKAIGSQKDKGVAVSWECHSHLALKAFFVNFYGPVEGF